MLSKSSWSCNPPCFGALILLMVLVSTPLSGTEGLVAQKLEPILRFDVTTFCCPIRSAAARNIGFVGFLSYAWGKNAMEVSDEEMIHFEETYRNQTLP